MIACKSCGAVNREGVKTCCRCQAPIVGRMERDTIVEVRPVDPHRDDSAVPDWPKMGPVMLTLSRGRALVAHYRFESPVISIGRGVEQDIVIDDESVSREHFRVRREVHGYVVHDLGTSNGTTVNGRAAVLQKLAPGDEIGVGEFVLTFEATPEQLQRLEYVVKPEGGDVGRRAAETLHLDQVRLDRIRLDVRAERTAHLRVIGDYGGRPGKRFALLEEQTIIGRAIDADVPLVDTFVKPRHALVIKEEDAFTIRHVGGLRRVYVNGKVVREARLKNRDAIRIGGANFQFFESV